MTAFALLSSANSFSCLAFLAAAPARPAATFLGSLWRAADLVVSVGAGAFAGTVSIGCSAVGEVTLS